MRIGWLIVAIVSALVLLQLSDSFVMFFDGPGPKPAAQRVQQPVTFIVGDGVPLPEDRIDYKIITGVDETAWLRESRERRSQLNEIRYIEDWEDQQELREDMKRSENWRTTIDGETLIGYDVIRDIDGEFTDFPETEKSDVYYQQIVRYGYS